MEEKEVVRNIVKIRTLNRWTKREIALKLNINEASYGRIESGKVALTYNYLARIAKAFDMSVIDVLTYPKKYVEQLHDVCKDPDPVKAVLQIELQNEKKEQILKLVLGEKNLEILNK